jgi:hypothetical protein
VIDAVLRFKIVGIGRGPMLIQRRTDFLISHSGIVLLPLLIADPPRVYSTSSLGQGIAPPRTIHLFGYAVKM